MTPIVESLAEEWRPVPGILRLNVLNLGNVRRLGYIDGIWRPVTPYLNHGYRLVRTKRDDGKWADAGVHRLVLIAFRGPQPSSIDAAHINGVKTDNRLANLRWATRLENNRDKAIHGTQNRGSNIGGAKLTEDQIPLIIQMHRNGAGGRKIAKAFGMSRRAIMKIVRGRLWKHVSREAV